MKPVFITVGFAFLMAAACKQNAGKKETVKSKAKPIVIFQPLQFGDSVSLQQLKDYIEAFYPVRIIIAANQKFPDHINYKPRNRYRADRIIHWLRMNIADSVRTIVGITDKDISTTKNDVYDYGVMGLGYHPGHACVVSTFRPAKTARNKHHLQSRLLRLIIHEMGHNFNLPHCPNEQCFMVDAEGQMKLDNEHFLCASCKSKLKL